MARVKHIRNEYGIFINTECFREEAINYNKYGRYCSDPWGSPSWYSYWKEQRKRCIDGYQVGNAKITGDHYFYLNFFPIMKVEDATSNKSKKVKDFPDFWDGDYNYFWVRDIARNGITLEDYNKLNLFVKIPEEHLKGGYNLIVGKARRKGYSYKSAAIGVNNYFTKPDSYTLYGAFDKKYLYPKGLFSMARASINFINQATAWSYPSDVINKQDHVKASYLQVKNGMRFEKGFLSEIQAITFKDNPDAARGKDAEDIFFEEAGAWGTASDLKSAYKATQDCVMAGAIKTGMITIFGTSGDMEGGTADYADMFQRPEAFGLLPFNNVWDEAAERTTVGFFHPINWNMEGFYDSYGNSSKDEAKQIELNIREKLKRDGATTTELQGRLQEKPLTPSEAFASASINTFPVIELRNQLTKVIANDYQKIKGTPVEMVFQENSVKVKPILKPTRDPITSLYNLPKDIRGYPVIYEYPQENSPQGLYKIGYDPIRQEHGSSLAAIIVYKSSHIGHFNNNLIVAEYIGRYEDPDDIDKIAEQFAILYNTKIMYENEVIGVKNYFRLRKKLDLLAVQPDKVISKNVKNSKVARVYGCHMTPQLKDAGERYVKSWLTSIENYDENGDPVTVIDKIYSRRLLEELIAYSRNGNFDLISSLFMCMFQVQEEELNKEYGTAPKNDKIQQLVNLLDDMYKN